MEDSLIEFIHSNSNINNEYFGIRESMNLPETYKDEIFTNIYYYYNMHGYNNIIASKVISLFIVVFTVITSTFLFCYVDWSSLLIEQTDNTDFRYYLKDFDSSSPIGIFIIGNIIIVILYLFWCIFDILYTIHRNRKIHELVNKTLKISDHQLSHISFDQLLERLAKNAHTRDGRPILEQHIPLIKRQAVARICRSDNYIISLYQKNPLIFNRWFITRPIKWIISKIIWIEPQRDQPGLIKKRCRYVMLLSILLIPFTLLFIFTLYIMRYAEDYHNHHKLIGTHWTYSAYLQLRRINELPHLAKCRIDSLIDNAVEFLDFHRNPLISTVASFFSYISATIMTFLILLMFLDESIVLHTMILEKNLLFYIGVFSAIFTVSNSYKTRSFDVNRIRILKQKLEVLLPEDRDVLDDNNDYLEEQLELYRTLRPLIHFKPVNYLTECLSILYVPYIIGYYIPKHVSVFFNLEIEIETNDAP